MKLEELSIGFIGDRSAFVNGDALLMDTGYGRVLEIISRKVRRLTISFSKASQQMPYHDFPLSADNVDFLPLPWIPSIAGGFYKVSSCRRTVREVERRCDVVIVQLPFAATAALLAPGKPRLYHICSNIEQVVRQSSQYAGFKRLGAVLLSRSIDMTQRSLIHLPGARSLANGADLFGHYGIVNGSVWVSSVIKAQEIMSVERQRPQDSAFRILFVGYFRHMKGIETLLSGFKMVLESLPEAELHFVGGINYCDGKARDLIASTMAALPEGRIKLMGYVGFSGGLFQHYADADVLAVPSLSEGTPRVIIEAGAFGCPVVASRVGGIPSSVNHEVDGLLVAPNDPQALKEAILRIAREAKLRQTLKRGGFERAQRYTVEAFADRFLDEIRTLLSLEDH